MKRIKRKLTVFLINYALIPAVIIFSIIGTSRFLIPADATFETTPVSLLYFLFFLLVLLILWGIAQAIITIVFLVMKKKLNVILPSVVITALMIVLVMTQAVPYLSPAMMLKIVSIAVLGYLISVGYSYQRLKISQLAIKRT